MVIDSEKTEKLSLETNKPKTRIKTGKIIKLSKRVSQKSLKMWSVIFFLSTFLSLLACDEKERMKQQAMTEMWQRGKDVLSRTYEDGQDLNYEYDLGPDWVFSGNQIETLFTKGFFFLFEIASTFTNSSDKDLKVIIRSIHSCSGAMPQHFVLIKRTHFKFNDKTGEAKLTKTEVLEGGELTLAPTKQDIFYDVLYSAVKDDEQLEEFLVKKGFLPPEKQVDFKRILKETGKASLGRALIEKGIFNADEWEHIKRLYLAEKRKGALSQEDFDRLFRK